MQNQTLDKKVSKREFEVEEKEHKKSFLKIYSIESLEKLQEELKEDKEKIELFDHINSTSFLDTIMPSKKSKYLLSPKYFNKALIIYSKETIPFYSGNIFQKEEIEPEMTNPTYIPTEREFYNSLTGEEKTRYDNLDSEWRENYRYLKCKLKTLDDIANSRQKIMNSINEKAIRILEQIKSNTEKIKKNQRTIDKCTDLLFY